MGPNPNYWWIGQRAIDCIGLHLLLPINMIISCDYGQESEWVADLVGANIFSLEKESGTRKVWSNYTIQDAVRSFVKAQKSSTSIPTAPNVAIAYRSNTVLEELSEDSAGWLRIAAPSAEIVSKLDDKIYCFDELGRWGVTQPRGEVCVLSKIDYKTLSGKFGNPLVIKQHTGASGSGTYFVSSEKDFSGLISRLGDQDVLVMEFIEGLSYNIHAVARQGELLISAPSVQLVGLRECTNRSEVYCGNDFSAIQAIDPEIVDSIRSETEKIGRWMLSQGYQGIFGVDFVGTSERLVALDINPRFQGSTSLLTQAEILKGYLPLSLLHVFEFINPKSYRSYLFTKREPARCLFGSQIILHSLHEQTRVVKQCIAPGLYKITKSTGLQFQRPGISVFDCRSPDEFVITCGVPKIGTTIEPGASLLKIVSTKSVIDLNTGRLNGEAMEIVRQVYASIELY